MSLNFVRLTITFLYWYANSFAFFYNTMSSFLIKTIPMTEIVRVVTQTMNCFSIYFLEADGISMNSNF